MRKIELIIFDLDGTLIDSRQDIVNAVNHTLRKIHLKEKSLSEISSFIGAGVEDLIRKSIRGKENCCFEEALSTFVEYYKKHSLDNTRLYPGVKEILRYFDKKRKVIVTNRRYEFAVNAMRALDIYDCFENISGEDNLGCMKPSSCPLDKAMNQLHTDKEKTIIVGDMDIDILAGKNAGILTCAVTYGIGKGEDILKAGPDYTIDSLAELKDIIN